MSHVRGPTFLGCPDAAARHLPPAQACWGQAHLRLPRCQWLETAAPPPPEPQQQQKAQPAQQHVVGSEECQSSAQQSALCCQPAADPVPEFQKAHPAGPSRTAVSARYLRSTWHLPHRHAPEPCQSNGWLYKCKGSWNRLAALWTWAGMPNAEHKSHSPPPISCMQAAQLAEQVGPSQHVKAQHATALTGP